MTAVGFVLFGLGGLLFSLLDPQEHPGEDWRGHLTFWPLLAGVLLILAGMATWLWKTMP